MGRRKGMVYDAYLPQVRVKSEMRGVFNVFMHINKTINLKERDESDLIRRIIRTHPDYNLIEMAISTGVYDTVCQRFGIEKKTIERFVDECLLKETSPV
jgi:hypothetical protein